VIKHQLIWVIAIIAITVVLSLVILSPGAQHTDAHENKGSVLSNTQENQGPSAESNHDHKKPPSKDNSKVILESLALSEPSKGSKGGKLFSKNDFGVEVTIFEKGAPPQFRLYLYENDEQISPSLAKVNITLSRLGTPAQVFNFQPGKDYLFSDQIVEEPHSFDMVIEADFKGRSYRWAYSQIEARVKIPDEILKSIGIEIRKAGPAKIKPMLRLPGEIGFNEYNIVQVVPRAPGQVFAVNRQRGEHVRKGDVLAVIESPLLVDLRSQFLAAKKRLAFARITFEREKELWEERISAKQDYLAAQQALNDAEINKDLASAKLLALGIRPEKVTQGENLARYEIHAPVTGLITARTIATGQTVKEDSEIFVIADTSTVWAQIIVYEKDLDVLKIGEETLVKATAIDIKGKGSVTFITPLIGVATRTATARVELDNPEGRWLPGMFVTAELVRANVQVPVAVSADAIQTLGEWTVVFGRYDQYFEARPLKLGLSDGSMVEVITGLTAGEPYAAGNSFIIKSELGKSEASHEH